MQTNSDPGEARLGQAGAQQAHCELHGPYVALVMRYGRGLTGCHECQQEKLLAERRAEEEERLAMRRRKWRDEWLEESGLRPRFRDATFDTFHATTPQQLAVLEACRLYAQQAGQGETRSGSLFLMGPPGTGKTHLAAAIVLHTIIERERGATLVTVSDLVRAVRATWRRDAESTEEAVIARFGSVGLLVLDDLGAGYGSDGEAKILLDVLDARYSRALPTVVTTNLKPKQVQVSIGDRAADRLRERATVLSLTWPSHRQPGGSEAA